MTDLGTPYAPPSTGANIDLFLDANEGPGGCVDLVQLVSSLAPDAMRRYPSAVALERMIADHWKVDPSSVLVTPGGDEAIDRACRAFLGPGRVIILPTPAFEMIARFASATGATIVTTTWAQGPYRFTAGRHRPFRIALSRPQRRTRTGDLGAPHPQPRSA